ncbi:MAG TPA: ATP-binding protein [Candidatus Onthocola gallistercoris]|uniref:ATP-binding protein n=1 Tax=Candidatus Onthocola gallistercoris TaxID=2840876 RepID=A0A9D1KW31_9FIRM|nr:ATP-binding protein [Candidatus Onthocola gallistercoris]
MIYSGKWMEDFRKEPAYGLSAVCGFHEWKRLFGGCIPDGELDPLFHVSVCQMFLLWGAAGSGKSTLCEALAGELALAGYVYIRIPALLMAGNDSDQACENVKSFGSALKDQLEQGKKICLFLEHVEYLTESPSACRIMEQIFTDIENREWPFILTATANDRRMVCPELAKSMLDGPVRPPGRKDRRRFLQTFLSPFLSETSPVSLEYLTEHTEGLTYGRLMKLINCFRLALKQETAIRYEFREKAIRQAMEKGDIVISPSMAETLLQQAASDGGGAKWDEDQKVCGYGNEVGKKEDGTVYMSASGGARYPEDAKDAEGKRIRGKEEKNLIEIIEALDQLKEIV